MSIKEDKTVALRERSGNVVISSRLTSFIYELMRDHLTPGAVETLIQNSENEPNIIYTNGWLAKYAEDLANRLQDK